MRELKTKLYSSGVQNKIPSEEIAQDAASDSLSWITQDGEIKLAYGRQEYGIDSSAAVGGIYGEIFAPRSDGTKVHYRKKNTVIQYYNPANDTWTDVVTGLTDGSLYFFAPYASLAGNFLYMGGPDGLYKVHLANPASYKNMYDATKNYLGYILVNQARMFLWNRFDGQGDKTALYLSKIDPQGTNYTTVTNENLGASGSTNYTGTLAQATGTRFVFALTITGTTGAGVETFTDNGNGVLTSDKGGTGTINYATGAYNITFDAVTTSGNVEADYQYEDSNSGGITDFTFSAPRLAGEGDIIPQEYLGEPIQNVIPFDNKYYSFKTTSVYELDLTDDDTNAVNAVYRSDIGIASPRGVVATGRGIAYIDTGNPDIPFLSMLIRNPVGGNLEPINLTPLFKWENYTFDELVMDTWGENIVLSAKSYGSLVNDRLFLVNTTQKYSVDISYYGVNTFAKNGGVLYGGSPLSEVVYELFTEFDDIGTVIENYWEGKNENFGDDILKQERWIQLAGLIDPNQSYEVYMDFDNSGYQLVGTVLGSASYVDISSPQLIGGSMLGSEEIGGGDQNVTVYPYICQIRLRTPQFRVRKLKLVALGFGFVSVQWQKDVDILTYRNKLPGKYLQKQFVSLNGQNTDQPNFGS
jgi:hypothetical protein